MSKFAWVTLATNDSYSLGALVVAASLKRAATAHQLAVLITPGVSAAMRTKLQTVFDVVQEVNVLDSRDSANLALLARPELGVTFTKLHCWNLTQFDKCVFLDADTLVLQNCDELFEREELSAAPDVGWPDCFNSGVFVFRPSQDTFGKLLDFAVKSGSFDGGDQGLLNLYFSDWAHSDISKHLPFVYNTCSTATYSYLPAFKQFGRDVKILHFIGTSKPWLQNFDPQTRTVRTPENYSHLACHLQTWWSIFFDQIHPHLTTDMNQQKEATTWYEEPQHDPPCPPYVPPPSLPTSNTFHPNSVIEIPTQEHQEIQQIHYYDPWEDYERNTEIIHKEVSEEYVKIDHFIEKIQENREEENFEHQSVQSRQNQKNSEEQTCQEVIYREESRQELFHNTEESRNEIPEITETKEIDPGPNKHSPELQKMTEILENRLPELIPPNTNSETPSEPPPGKLTVEKSPQESPKTPERQVNSISGTNDVKSTSNESGIAGALANVTLGEQRTPEQEALESQMRRQCWESGNIDYMGRDSFENILKRINLTMGETPETQKEDVLPEAKEGNQ
ncbi:glycogenin-1 isoform X2 [Phlebotomus papatasi]|uniref:glycogenin-1 isoform X2 n=1 Tax=Phlebotomus papatasi TaxID=29031 RepID=UPI002484316B|nr:glycogenin-1 isoform X2 [Phlebotomus papatasi]